MMIEIQKKPTLFPINIIDVPSMYSNIPRSRVLLIPSLPTPPNHQTANARSRGNPNGAAMRELREARYVSRPSWRRRRRRKEEREGGEGVE